MAVGFIYIRNFLIGLKGINDTQCGFKLFEKEAALTIIKHLKVFNNEKIISGSSVSAGFDLEFLYLASKYYCVKEVPVTWRHVETKNVNFIKDSIETLFDIAKIKYNEITKKYPENV
jgi:dolichyl-phosphate beta-glucosyltransferase